MNDCLYLHDFTITNSQFSHFITTLAVVGILDHHKDERPSTSRCLCHCKIEMVGSCCTLVTETILADAPDFLTSDSAIVPLLLGTILLDTVNLSEQVRKKGILIGP